MTHPVTGAAVPTRPLTFEIPETEAAIGVIATAVCMLINPITGAAVGTYFLASIATEIAFEKMNLSNATLMGKVAKIVASSLAGFAAALGVLTVLGVSVALTPTLFGCVIGFVAMGVLAAIANHHHHR